MRLKRLHFIRSLVVVVASIMILYGCFGSDNNDSNGAARVLSVLQLSAGWHHTCAVVNEGGQSRVKCWGSNQHGELGNGTTNDSTTPVTVLAKASVPLSGVKQVSASRYYTCALMNDGTVKCWGWNEGGKLGNGMFDYDSLCELIGQPSGCFSLLPPQLQPPYQDQVESAYPVDVMIDAQNKLSDVKQISAGSWHACALKTDGTVWCWGQNIDGAIGIGKDFSQFDITNPDWSLIISPYAQQVKDSTDPTGYLQDVIQVVAGSSDHTCALIDSDGDGKGSIRCWAWNGTTEGQLGINNTTDDYVTEPASEVVDENYQVITNAVELAAGGDHTCALLSTSEVVCWGRNNKGQIGDNSTTNAPVARKVVIDTNNTPLSGVKAIVSERGNHTCAIMNDGSVYCWGDNSHGQLGDGSSNLYIAHAVKVTGLPDSVEELAAGGGGRKPAFNNQSGAVIDYDGDHTCALTSSGDVYCWGSNDRGQLGDGTTTDSASPVKTLL